MLLVIVSVVIIHIIYLIFNTVVVYAMRTPMPEAVAVVIMVTTGALLRTLACTRLSLQLLHEQKHT
jgi:hypothetical protein